MLVEEEQRRFQPHPEKEDVLYEQTDDNTQT
jgi:hypothetical protein